MNEKIAFLTTEIGITPTEGQTFWPVYNQVQKDKDEAMRNVFKTYRAMSKALEEGKSSKELEKLLDAYLDAQLNSSKVWMKHLPIFEVLSYTLNFILMLYGGYMAIQGEITLGNLVTVNGYLWMLTVPLRFAGWWVNDIFRFTTSVE